MAICGVAKESCTEGVRDTEDKFEMKSHRKKDLMLRFARIGAVSVLVSVIMYMVFWMSALPPLSNPYLTPSSNMVSTDTTLAASAPPPPVIQQSTSCPDYFRWIHEDLHPWSSTGITRDAMEMATFAADFRLIIVGGRVYVELYKKSYKRRDVFTLWGILQLLRRYPGRVPDLELVFSTVDSPLIYPNMFVAPNDPPPLFHYVKNHTSLDILFPDWSFWGWPASNINPWEKMIPKMMEENKKVEWVDREPYAYWKGTIWGIPRKELLSCNVTEENDWNARLYGVDWKGERDKGFKSSEPPNHCKYRYRIYVDGYTWSASAKYILACNSPTLMVESPYEEFFRRGLMPGQHYLPIKANDKCRSIKLAVDWGNSHPQQAQEIGIQGSKFVQEQVSMDYVYDYMFHLLTEYAKLLEFEPSVPEKAIELTTESMLHFLNERQYTGKNEIIGDREWELMMESMVTSPRSLPPCSMPPQFSPMELGDFIRSKHHLKNMEREFWGN